jgi:hypothetical protein
MYSLLTSETRQKKVEKERDSKCKHYEGGRMKIINTKSKNEKRG